MNKKTDYMYAQFFDGIVIEDYLWCVEIKAPMLLCIDTKSWNVVRTVWLGDYVDKSNLARKMFLYDNKLYITFQYGRIVLCVDILNLQIELLHKNSSISGATMDAVLYKESLFMYPKNMRGEATIINLKEKSVRQEKILGMNDEIACSLTYVKGCFMYGVIDGTNKVLCVNLSSQTYLIKELNADVTLRDMTFTDHGICFLDQSNLLFCTSDFEVEKSINISEIEQCRHIIYNKEEIILIPMWGISLYKYLLREDELIELEYENILPHRTKIGSLVLGYHYSNKSLWMYPCMGNVLIEYKVADTVVKTNEIYISEKFEREIGSKVTCQSMIFEGLYGDLKEYVNYVTNMKLCYDSMENNVCTGQNIYNLIDKFMD